MYAMTGEGTDYADLATGISLTEELYGVSFRKGSDLAPKFNEFMAGLKADTVGNYTEMESMNGLTIAVENGSAGQDAANGIAGANVVALQDQAAALLEVKAGTADACVIDITMAYAMTGEGTDYADLAPGLSLTEELYGVSFRKGSDLAPKFNEFMAGLKADGTLQALADKYDLTLAN